MPQLWFRPGQFHVTLHKLLVDALLDIYPAGGQADLALVGEAGTHHNGKTFLEVHIIEHETCILAYKLCTVVYLGIGNGVGGVRLEVPVGHCQP